VAYPSDAANVSGVAAAAHAFGEAAQVLGENGVLGTERLQTNIYGTSVT